MSELIKADICVIGAGSGGLSVAAGASQMGARSVLIELLMLWPPSMPFKQAILPAYFSYCSPCGPNNAIPAESYPRYSSLRKPSRRISPHCFGPVYPTIPHTRASLRCVPQASATSRRAASARACCSFSRLFEVDISAQRDFRRC